MRHLAQFVGLLVSAVLWVGGCATTQELVTEQTKATQRASLVYEVTLPQPVRGISLNRDGTLLAAGHAPQDQAFRVNIWRLDDGRVVRTLSSPNINAPAAFTADGTYLFAGATEMPGAPGLPRFGTVSGLWRVSDGLLVRKFDLGRFIWGYSLSPDSAVLAYGYFKQVVLTRFPDLESFAQLDCGKLEPFLFSPNGRLILCKSGDEVRVYRTADGSRMQTSTLGKDVSALAFSHGGELLAAASKQRIEVWRMQDGQRIGQIELQHKDTIIPYATVRWHLTRLVFSHDDQNILVAYHVVGRSKNAGVLEVRRIRDSELLSSYGEEVEHSRLWGVRSMVARPWDPLVHPQLGVVLVKVSQETNFAYEPLDDNQRGELTVSIWRLDTMSELMTGKESAQGM